jgi:hypothetical protein
MQALPAAGVRWKDRVYSPLVTLWVFLGQVLSQDLSCRAAVARLIAQRDDKTVRGKTRIERFRWRTGAGGIETAPGWYTCSATPSWVKTQRQ